MPKIEYTIHSLKSAFDVIESFIKMNGHPLRFSDIHRITGLSKNRTYRILATLCERDYLEKDARTNEYRLGTTFLILGELYWMTRLSLREASLPIIKELSTRSGDAALLTIPYREGLMAVVEGVQGENYSLQGRIGIGEVYSLHGGASSKFFLAAMSDEERLILLDRMDFKRFTDKTITNRQDLEKEIQIAMAQGYYIAEEDLELGLISIAAPVRDDTGQIMASLSIVLPTVRYTEEHKKETIELVVEAARRLSRKLGYRGVKEITS